MTRATSVGTRGKGVYLTTRRCKHFVGRAKTTTTVGETQ